MRETTAAAGLEAVPAFPNAPTRTDSLYGGKTIGLAGGAMLLANNLAGPTVSLMPGLAQEGGWLAMVGIMCFLGAFSAWCGFMLLDVMRAMPGNSSFQERIEFTDVLEFYFPTVWFRLTVLCYFGYLVVTLMSYVIQTAQVLDYVTLWIFGSAYGLELWPRLQGTQGALLDSASPFDGETVVLSGSFAVVAVVCAPFAWMNLDDNILLQWFATVGFSALVVVWLCFLTSQPTFPGGLPAATTSVGNLTGTLLFNFAFMSGLPSWANEKKPGVSVANTFLLSIGFMCVVYSTVGIVGGLAFEPFYQTDENLFSKLDASGSWVARSTVAAYPVLQNLTSIPVFSILIRYNLTRAFPSLGHATATGVAFLLPWALSVPFYTGSGFEQVADVGGMAFSSVVNFIVPVVLYVLARKRGLIADGDAVCCTEADLSSSESCSTDDSVDDDARSSSLGSLKG